MKCNVALKAMKVLVLVAVLLPEGVYAQEFIKRGDSQKTEFSLVREQWGNQKWIVYNDNSYYFNFGVMNAAGTINSFIKTSMPIHLKDMELTSDTLYFCGSIYDPYTSAEVNGIMGYFCVSDMPNPTIRYIVADSLVSLNKLDYYKRGTTKHVVMTGTGVNGRDYIVDAFYDFGSFSTGSWSVSRTFIPDVNAKFDDITAIAEYVVVSARVSDSSAAYLCFIEETDLPAFPFFLTSQINMKKLQNTPSSPVLLQGGLHDTVYVVYKQSIYLNIVQFKGQNNIAAKRIQMPISSFYPFTIIPITLLGVSTDRHYKNINILVDAEFSSGTQRRIYHAPVNLLMSGGSFNYHIYDLCHTLHSLGRSLDNSTLGVGNYNGEWMLFKHQNNTVGNCTTMGNSSFGNVSLTTFSLISKNHSFVTTEVTLNVMPINNYPVTITTICQ